MLVCVFFWEFGGRERDCKEEEEVNNNISSFKWNTYFDLGTNVCYSRDIFWFFFGREAERVKKTLCRHR